jgi:molybdopterin-guanine dinucleotide biosynthesis protein
MRPEDLVVEGGITEIFGGASTGRTSLLVACLRQVTRRGAMAALVDTDHVFDPQGAARAGIELSRVLWVRCGRRPDRALRAADLLVRCPGFALVALDTGTFTPRLSLAGAYRLKLAVLRARTALVIVARHRLVDSGAALALEAARRGCQWAGPRPAPTRLEGAGTAVTVVRAAGGAVSLHPGSVHLAWWQA